MIIFTKLCKVQKYFVKKSQNFDLARFKCMSCKISRDDIYQKQIPNESLINRVFRRCHLFHEALSSFQYSEFCLQI